MSARHVVRTFRARDGSYGLRTLYEVVDTQTGRTAGRYRIRAYAQASADHRNRGAGGRTRPCMTCRRPFVSEGSHNCMCDHCRDTKSGLPTTHPGMMGL